MIYEILSQQMQNNSLAFSRRLEYTNTKRWYVGNGEWAFFPRDSKNKQQVQDNIRQQTKFNSKLLSDKDIQLMTLSLNSS